MEHRIHLHWFHFHAKLILTHLCRSNFIITINSKFLEWKKFHSLTNISNNDFLTLNNTSIRGSIQNNYKLFLRMVMTSFSDAEPGWTFYLMTFLYHKWVFHDFVRLRKSHSAFPFLSFYLLLIKTNMTYFKFGSLKFS